MIEHKQPVTRLARRAQQRGVALAIVALILLLLTVLIVTAHYTIISQTSSTATYRDSTQAFYFAEAGTQRAIDWFSHKYAPPTDWATTANVIDSRYPAELPGNIRITLDSTGGSTFPVAPVVNDPTNGFTSYVNAARRITASSATNLEGQYDVTATLLSTKLVATFNGSSQLVERWRIQSRGRLINSNANNVLATAENVAVIETLTQPVVSHAICVNNDFRINGQPAIDSFDSALGSYGAAGNANGPASIGALATASGMGQGGFQFNGPPGYQVGGQLDLPANVPSGSPAVPAVCVHGANGCGSDYCPALPPIPTFVNTNHSGGLAYPTIGTNAGNIPNDLRADKYYYRADHCPGGCLSANNCSPFPMYNAPNNFVLPAGGLASLPVGSGLGPVVQELRGDQTAGARVGLPANFAGSACFWTENMLQSGAQGTITIDNLTNRVGNGPMNVFLYALPVGNGDIKIVANKNNPVNLYILDSVGVNGNGTINIKPPSAPLPNPAGAVYGSQNVQGLNIYFAKVNDTFKIAGNSQVSALVYAPNSLVEADGASDIFGAVISDTFRRNGGGGGPANGIHFDTQLANNIVNVYNFVLNTEVRRIY